jgi:hypothetical protein
MAPEILTSGANYTSKVDVYAYGILVWELATGETPYRGMNGLTIVKEVRDHDIRPPLPLDLNPVMCDLITQCWHRNPDVRPTFDEIVRRFEIDKLVFNGANREEFCRYIRASATTGELRAREVKRVVQQVVAGELPLSKATSALKSIGIPPELLENCWTALVGTLSRFPEAAVSDYLLLFAKSSRMHDAVVLLRAMERGRVPVAIVSAFVAEIPTGAEEVDTAIAITACRNGCADLCSLYATRTADIALALEVVAQLGADVQLRPAVVDRCIQSLGNADARLAAAALKCLLALRELKRVTFKKLAVFVAGADRMLSSLAHFVIAKMALDGLYPPIDLFEMLTRKMPEDGRARLAVIAGCRDADLAGRLVALYEGARPAASDAALKALAAAARHRTLRSRIRRIVEDVGFA